MEIIVKKWGNSLGIRIPASVARGLQLGDGSIVELSQSDDRIIIVPKKKGREEELALLLSRITAENLHCGEFFGEESGKEIW